MRSTLVETTPTKPTPQSMNTKAPTKKYRMVTREILLVATMKSAAESIIAMATYNLDQ